MASLLVDEGIGQDLVQILVAQGFVAHHWLEFGPKGANDSLVFAEAQQRQLTIFTWNRDDYILLTEAWSNWGHGDHHGIIARQINQPQLLRPQAYIAMEHYCWDTSSYLNRVEMF